MVHPRGRLRVYELFYTSKIEDDTLHLPAFVDADAWVDPRDAQAGHEGDARRQRLVADRAKAFRDLDLPVLDHDAGRCEPGH